MHPEKSCLVPSTCLSHLGFQFDSHHMTVRVGRDKIDGILTEVHSLMVSSRPTIRVVASVSGKLNATCLAVPYGQLHLKSLDRCKNAALSRAKGDYDACMSLSSEALQDLSWWVSHLRLAVAPLHHPPPSVTLFTDASNKGWGAVRDKHTAGGHWGYPEVEAHINVLELKAVLLSLQALCNDFLNVHILVYSDNTTTVAYINHMGGTKSQACDAMAHKLWVWCEARRLHLSAVHIPGVDNTCADGLSREFDSNTEWQLNVDIFQELHRLAGRLDVDLFATRLNHQLPVYASWQPDPGASWIDTLRQLWTDMNFYAFPPFNLIHRVLRKFKMESASRLLIVPLWPT